MNSNTVSVINISETDAEQLESVCTKFGTVWLARFVPVFRGAIVIMSSCEEAAACVAGLHGMLVGESSCCASIGARVVSFEQVAEFGLAPPKRMIQLVSPPPSPPEWWTGWSDMEGGPKNPPELVVDPTDLLPAEKSASRVRELNILGVDLYEAVQSRLGDKEQQAGSGAPRLTIEAPPESINNIPEGFMLVQKKKE
jgi:hypothetical protein